MDKCLVVKMGKIFETFLEGLNTWLKKGCMLANYALVWTRSLSNKSD